MTLHIEMFLDHTRSEMCILLLSSTKHCKSLLVIF